MERGIFRIIAGIGMMIFQLLMSLLWTDPMVSSDIWQYTYGIVGLILLIFGYRAYSNGEYSRLTLHVNSKRIHNVTKWIAFTLCVLLLVCYTVMLAMFWSASNIFYICIILSALSFIIYSLFYMYRKPSCLFSAALIFIALFYLYTTILNMSLLFHIDNITHFLLFVSVPRLLVGILYIVIAIKLYKEDHSVRVIKILGWIALALESIVRIPEGLATISQIPQYSTWEDLFLIIAVLVEIGYVVILWLYLSVFKINTLRTLVAVEEASTIKFCRKCGEKLINNSNFCRKCGTEIIKEIEE